MYSKGFKKNCGIILVHGNRRNADVRNREGMIVKLKALVLGNCH